MDKNLHKPGTDNLPKGEYLEVGSRGGAVPNARVVSIDQGDRLPPTQEKNRKWKKIQFQKSLCSQQGLLYRDLLFAETEAFAEKVNLQP